MARRGNQVYGQPDKLLEPEHGALDARLRVRVVVLDAVQQLAQAPVRVRLRRIHRLHDFGCSLVAHSCTRQVRQRPCGFTPHMPRAASVALAVQHKQVPEQIVHAMDSSACLTEHVLHMRLCYIQYVGEHFLHGTSAPLR